jgi:PPIC-type PPIASE domain/SurA N-terminal domain
MRRSARFRLAVPALAAIALAAAGCGGSSSKSSSSTSGSSSGSGSVATTTGGLVNGKVPSGDVAIVGKLPITKKDFNDFLSLTIQTQVKSGTQAPKPGSAAYDTLTQNVLKQLVQLKEIEQAAEAKGLKPTVGDVTKNLGSFKTSCCAGKDADYQALLKKANVSESFLKQIFGLSSLSNQLYTEVTKDATFQVPQNRSIQYILINSNLQKAAPKNKPTAADKALAEKLYKQIQGGADFTALAKKNSNDTGSKASGGKVTEYKGIFVPEFEKASFALKVNAVTLVTSKNYGYFIIKALGPLVPAKKAKAADYAKDTTIGTQAQQAQANEANTYFAKLEADIKKQTAFAAGYTLPSTATVPTATASTAPGSTSSTPATTAGTATTPATSTPSTATTTG